MAIPALGAARPPGVDAVTHATAHDPVGVEIRIEGSDLPGLSCGASGDFPGYENIHVGVQRRNRRDELLGTHPADAPAVVWRLDCDVVETETGLDFKGPYIQGRPHERFIYLSWGTVDRGRGSLSLGSA